MTDVEVNTEMIEDTIIIVIRDPPNSSSECLLGMNILQRLQEFPLHNFKIPQPSPDRAYLARTTREVQMIPPATVMNISVTGGHPSWEGDVLVEPSQTPPRPGLLIMTTLTTIKKGTMTVQLVNTSEETMSVPARLVVGLISKTIPTRPAVKLIMAGDQDRSVQAHLVGAVKACSDSNHQDPDFDQLKINPDLKTEDQQQLKDLVKKCTDVFAWTDKDLGFTDLIEHEIHLVDDTPICQPYRRIPPSVIEEVRDHLEDLLERDVIRPSTSPFAAPIVIVRKKSGDLRVCVDYRKLNLQTRKDSFPLPRIDECLDAVGGATMFSSLDLASGYYQVAMKESDKQKTAFSCPFGLYEHNRMPFGLCNAPATFQRLMQSVMHDHIFRILLCYLDDILIYSKNFSDHLEALEKVLIRLREIGVKLNPSKCKLGQSEVPFLGHRISAEGISTDPDKVNAVSDWKTPTTVKEIRSFMGLAGYYRRFIKDFAKIAKPIHAVIPQMHQLYPKDKGHGEKKQIGDLWTRSCQQAFMELKLALTSAPILGFADYKLPFILEVDASQDGLGAVLSQDQMGSNKVIAYASRSLRPSEKNMTNYSSAKLELLGMKWSVVDKFRSYLLGHKFEVFTDNNPLSHLDTLKLGAVEQRWASELAAFDFKPRFRSGRVNQNADALSRNPVEEPVGPGDEYVAVTQITVQENLGNCPATRFCQPTTLEPEPVYCETITMAPPDPVILPSEIHDLSGDQKADPDLRHLISYLQQNQRPDYQSLSPSGKNLWRSRPKLSMVQGILCKSIETEELGKLDVPVIPINRRTEVINLAHHQHGHQGSERTLKLLRRRCYWPNMAIDISEAVHHCTRCQEAKKPGNKVFQPEGHLTATQPLEIVAIDFLTLDKASDGREDVLVLTDVFSKWATAVATRDKTAATVVRVLLQNWIVHYGVPLRLHSDQGKCFEATLLNRLREHYGIQKSRTTAFHPQGNGQCERYNRSLIALLQTLPPDQKRRWPEHLKEVTFFYNSTPHSTTGQSPYSLLFGRQPRLPVDVYLQTAPPPPSAAANHLAEHVRRINQLRSRAHERSLAQQKAASDPANHHGPVLQLGDQVLMKSHPLGRCKLEDNFKSTPATVVAIPPPTGGPFGLQLEDGALKQVSGSNLRKFYPPLPGTSLTTRPPEQEVAYTPTQKIYKSFTLLSDPAPNPGGITTHQVVTPAPSVPRFVAPSVPTHSGFREVPMGPGEGTPSPHAPSEHVRAHFVPNNSHFVNEYAPSVRNHNAHSVQEHAPSVRRSSRAKRVPERYRD